MTFRERKKSIIVRLLKYRWLYLLGLPGMAVIFLFHYLPMGSLLMAFEEYDPWIGLASSPFVGFKHFAKLFNDSKFYLMLRNTLTISALSLLTFPAPIILALLLNEVRSAAFKKTIQTTIYLPHFLSWTIVVSLTFFLLSSEQGLINKIIVSNGGTAHSFLFDKSIIYFIIVVQSVWKGVGWGSIVYLAAIAGIDQGLYEAAKIDGANKFQSIIHITLPCILPTVAVMLILKMGSIISVDFEQVLLMTNALVKDKLEVFEVYIYNNGVKSGSTQFSYTTAIGMFKSVVSTILVIVTNRIVSSNGMKGII
ncbi:MAG: sugar ABC transporter permease [Clostridia bacterium]|nr:sugar ABC transporter permease [Clostridia bacterium]MBR5986096.1 sugar ABC transporter permease [Clostridia bacterium]